MKKISINEFKQIMSFDIKKNATCIEIYFYIDDSNQYTSCWLGKLISKENKEVYWFGLMEDGTEAYNFDSEEQLLKAKVFDGKSLKDIWEMVTIISIDSCEVEDRLEYYSKKHL